MSYRLSASTLQVLSAGISINALGDSISAQPRYQAVQAPPPSFAAWQGSTAYAVGACVSNGGYGFYCSVAGTSASSGGPAPSTNAVTDGSVTWQFLPENSSKDGFLGWAEAFSLGTLNFDQVQGYSGPPNTLRKVMVVNGGSGYSVTPAVTLNQAATATATVVNGVITAVTVTNPGYGTSGFTAAVTDASGTGAVLSAVQDGSGTFASYGCTTADMVARLADCLASSIAIFTVLGGRNDIKAGVAFATITANLRTCYETLINAGRCIVVLPVFPDSTFTAAQSALAMRVNRWVRAYARQLAFANPLAYTRLALADCAKFLTDGTVLTSLYPVGGAGGTAAAVMIDGTHPTTRGRMYIGAVVAQAAQKFIGPVPLGTARPFGGYDGYDATTNPGGNALEGPAWAASTTYSVGQVRSSSGNVYRCTASGTSASSGGPSGTASNTDGGVTWSFLRPAGMSVMAGGTSGTLTAATNITYSGGLVSGYTLLRSAGSASGTVTGAVETPWSDGTVGQRQSLAFSLNSGTTSEQWSLRALFGTYGAAGFLTSELGTAQVYAEAEIELSGIANLASVYLQLWDSTIGWFNYAGATLTTATTRLPAVTDVLPIPNGGRMLLRTTRMVLPANLANLSLALNLQWDASGTAAGSAAVTLKVNYMGLFRALVA